MIQGHSKRKTIIRSSFILVLILSILISSISISFAKSEGAATTPEALIDSHPQLPAIANNGPSQMRTMLESLYDDTFSVATMWTHYYNQSLREGLFLLLSKGHILVLPDNNQFGVSFGIYSSVPHDELKLSYYMYGSYGGINSYYTATNPITINGYGTFYRCGDNYLYNYMNFSDAVYYCSDVIGFPEENIYAVENLDVSAYLPDPLSFEAWQITRGGSEYIECKVNSDLTTWGSYITIYGQYTYNGDVYPYGQTFGDSEYIYTDYYEDVNNVAWTTFMINPHSMGFENFTISGIEFTGWYPPESRYLYVDWSYGVMGLPQDEYDPPIENYYYSTFVNHNYSYNDSNGKFTSFGFGQLRGSSSNAAHYFWDTNKTLIQPYNYSVVAIPLMRSSTLVIPDTQLQTYIDVLSKSYDIILLDVPETTFDYLYGAGAYNDYDVMDGGNGLIDDWSLWYSAHPILVDVLPYSFVDNPPNYNIAQTVGFLYTDSFYLKSIAYIMGDTDDRLLDLTEKLVGEDGFAQTLFKQMKKTYDLHFTYYDDMIKYMNRLNYVTNQLVYSDYFNKVLSSFGSANQHLESLDSNFQTSFTDISSLLSRINESILGLDLSFENITLQFPEFNFDIIVDNHPTTNIEYFVDFVNNFFTALPDADYSPLVNIETNFSDIFDDLHIDDTYDNFLDSILDDYEFSDSHLSDYD